MVFLNILIMSDMSLMGHKENQNKQKLKNRTETTDTSSEK